MFGCRILVWKAVAEVGKAGKILGFGEGRKLRDGEATCFGKCQRLVQGFAGDGRDARGGVAGHFPVDFQFIQRIGRAARHGRIYFVRGVIFG